MSASVLVGDCREVMRTLEPASVDAIVTDPPYDLGFMGKRWDKTGVAFLPETWSLALAVVKPGARLLAFGGTRTFHRMTCAIEDAGWEIEDCLSWLYGSGFPKHKSKLKPAWEPIVLARKPARYATLLNIEGCRLTASGQTQVQGAYRGGTPAALAPEREGGREYPPDLGRWPANVALDEDAASLLDEQSGELTSGFMAAGTQREGLGYRGGLGTRVRHDTHGDTGGASRFFYTSKANRRERDAGLDEMPLVDAQKLNASGIAARRAEAGLGRGRNHHPTVKPLDLMQWLCRLITPKDGLILDPFCGSGSTGRAAIAEGFRFVGIELSPEYAAIARARITEYAPLFSGDVA